MRTLPVTVSADARLRPTTATWLLVAAAVGVAGLVAWNALTPPGAAPPPLPPPPSVSSTPAAASTAPPAPPNPAHGTAAPASAFERLKGKWRRPDGGYVLAITAAGEGGTLVATYLNPRPIRVSKARAFTDGGATRVFVELQGANYPGSTYDLTYDAASDQLKGIYFQAALQQRFDVNFERMR